jgi:hypothetical protein
VSTANLSPVNTVLGTALSSVYRGLGDVGNLLSEVKVSVFFGVNSLDFDERHRVILGAKATLVSKDGSVNVKADRLSHVYLYCLCGIVCDCKNEE